MQLSVLQSHSTEMARLTKKLRSLATSPKPYHHPGKPINEIWSSWVLFKKDINPNKLHLGMGYYRDGNGNPFILKSVLKAEESISKQKLDKEYSSLGGIEEFCILSSELAFADSVPTTKGHATTTLQTIGGTGALCMLGQFLRKFWQGRQHIYISNPTWTNHGQIFRRLGFIVHDYTYYDKRTCGFAFEEALENIRNIPEKSIIILQVCAHNPTGVDPTQSQWNELSQIIKERNIYPIFDMAYQGLATGNTDTDAYAVRRFASDGHQMAVTQSYSKIMGLYGDRIGALTLVCASQNEAACCSSQLTEIARETYLFPSNTGARLVAAILSNPDLRLQWLDELREMTKRIISIRVALKTRLESFNLSRSWTHITDQLGMFCFTGLKPEEINKLCKEYSIYMTSDGRICVSSMTLANADYLANSIKSVIEKLEN